MEKHEKTMEHQHLSWKNYGTSHFVYRKTLENQILSWTNQLYMVIFDSHISVNGYIAYWKITMLSMKQLAISTGPCSIVMSVNRLFLWPLSIVMLVYQRVDVEQEKVGEEEPEMCVEEQARNAAQ